MRRICFGLTFLMLLTAGSLEAATGRVIKVLPLYLDQKGRESLSPSLYERDAYQITLRDHPDRRSGIRFAIEWKAKGDRSTPLKLRLEVRGLAHGDLPKRLVLEEEVHPGGWFSHWASIALKGQQYKEFGEVTAWRVTLWDKDQMLSEEKSFLW
jgi:hypothetical protein